MYIRSVQIKNFGPIAESQELTFSPGFNLVVGANNVGKTNLLKALRTTFVGTPHLSMRSINSRGQAAPQATEVDLGFVVTQEEFRSTLLATDANGLRLPWPGGLRPDERQMAGVMQRYLEATSIPLNVRLLAQSGGEPSWTQPSPAVTRLFDPFIEGGQFGSLVFRANKRGGIFEPQHGRQDNGQPNDAGMLVAQVFGKKSYLFNAERLTLATSPTGGRTELLPNASNLPEVLHMLFTHNQASWRRYCAQVKEVLPTIEWITVVPEASNPHSTLEIRIWQHDHESERDDLAIPLNSSGSGVGQVLAILYVVRTSLDPRTIIIDEPGSFLHPGATRALIGILRQYPQHQYIIASHSPEVISELSEEGVTIVRWHDSMTKFEQADRGTKPVAAATLLEIGAKLSDVFGFDRILYVEGPSDADALKQMLSHLGKLCTGSHG